MVGRKRADDCKLSESGGFHAEERSKFYFQEKKEKGKRKEKKRKEKKRKEKKRKEKKRRERKGNKVK